MDLVATSFLDYDIGQCNLTECQISSSESLGSHPGKELSGGDVIDCLIRSSDSIPVVNRFPSHIGTEMNSCMVLNKILTERCIRVVPMIGFDRDIPDLGVVYHCLHVDRARSNCCPPLRVAENISACL
jgi:hypothetical protein